MNLYKIPKNYVFRKMNSSNNAPESKGCLLPALKWIGIILIVLIAAAMILPKSNKNNNDPKTEETMEVTTETYNVISTEIEPDSVTEAEIQATEQTVTENLTSESLETEEYVLNTNSQKVHLKSCSSVKDIKESNKLIFTGSLEELRSLYPDYEPCGSCRPWTK